MSRRYLAATPLTMRTSIIPSGEFMAGRRHAALRNLRQTDSNRETGAYVICCRPFVYIPSVAVSSYSPENFRTNSTGAQYFDARATSRMLRISRRMECVPRICYRTTLISRVLCTVHDDYSVDDNWQ